MKRVTREWARKAESDGVAARRELKARAYDLACFLAQQSVEKYLKAALEERGVPFPKTHDLGHLCGLVLPWCPALRVSAPRLRRISAYAVKFRYPGASATARQARAAVGLMISAAAMLREALGLPGSRIREPSDP